MLGVVGMTLTLSGKQYRVGRQIGTGGFGSIHLGLCGRHRPSNLMAVLVLSLSSDLLRCVLFAWSAASHDTKKVPDDKAELVVKFELESSGGLFSEMKSFQNLMLCSWHDTGSNKKRQEKKRRQKKNRKKERKEEEETKRIQVSKQAR